MKPYSPGAQLQSRMFPLFFTKFHFSSTIDNIDTRKVLESIRELVNVGNSYIQNNESRNRVLLKKSAMYMTKIFNILGLNAKPEEIGFTSSTESAGNTEEVRITNQRQGRRKLLQSGWARPKIIPMEAKSGWANFLFQ